MTERTVRYCPPCRVRLSLRTTVDHAYGTCEFCGLTGGGLHELPVSQLPPQVRELPRT